MIRRPPQLPNTNQLPLEIKEYLSDVNDYLIDVYKTLRNFDIGEVKISTGSAVPTGGEDGDIYVRIAGASTALYLNINGTFSAYTNP